MILAIVVTYYPEKELLERNIAAFIDEVDKVLIWENTPEDQKLLYRFINHPKADYCGDGINSISHALNYAWQYAAKYGYDYLLTMDQDSVLFNFEILKEYAFSHSEKMMILGPSFSQADTEGESLTAKKSEEIITSGTLIPVKVLDCLGGYDENLTIDGIDTELCLRANLQGIFSYQVYGCGLRQKFGQPQIKYYRGRKILINSYPAKRLRSILRVHIYLMRKYPNMSDYTRNHIKKHYIKNRVKEILLFEDKKIPKCYNLAMGIIEGMLIKV
jgi:rhamnosyltransferase